ncbi:MAG TPA: cupin domain-containing protein [Verrucomicrobiae bacterium]|nr:cupin domain-containing protein [Verrucomicrobiae bacterium]
MKADEVHALVNQFQVEAIQIQPNGNIPNSQLPLLVYRRAARLQSNDPASVFEKLFEANGWTDSWRNGIYDYHHYHSTAHEVLGVYQGHATVNFGGEGGPITKVWPGDVIIIPAGVSHKNLGASPDFGVVGAYPDGQKVDMHHGKPDERAKAEKNISELPMPEQDPVQGNNGPLFQYWEVS